MSHNTNPATRRGVCGARNDNRLAGSIGSENSIRPARLQYLVAHLHACGQRPVLEALLAVSDGTPLGDVLEDYARLPADIYRAVGADVLPNKDRLLLRAGGTP